MIYLADTHFTLRFANRSDPQHSTIRAAVRKLRQNGDEIKIIPQTCVEFWSVITRPPTRNGFGLTAAQADQSLRLVEIIFPLLSDQPNLYEEWRKLVVSHNVAGVQVYDARIVAALKTHGLTHILTFNINDFTRYSAVGIIAVDPTIF